MNEYYEKYRKLKKSKKAFRIGYFTFMILVFITGLTGIFVCEDLIGLFATLTIAGPAVMIVVYCVYLIKADDKKWKILDKELEESSLTADEVMELGEKLNINLFGVAISKRAKELGMDHIPEGYFRDGILPTRKDL